MSACSPVAPAEDDVAVSDRDFNEARRVVGCMGGVIGVIAMGLFFALCGLFTTNTLIGLTGALGVVFSVYVISRRFQ
jgi:predicted lipid-binding transport protein (Tim44 family)